MNISGLDKHIGGQFDMLRAVLESEMRRPAAVAVTASSRGDGQHYVAQELAASLASSGYRTLLLDSVARDSSSSSPSLSFGAAVSNTLANMSAGALGSLAFENASIQRNTSQREIESGLEILRTNYDYIIIISETEAASSFAMSLLLASDSAIVAVRLGRRRNESDARLSRFLNSIGERFLGVVVLESSLEIDRQGQRSGRSSSLNDRLVAERVHESKSKESLAH